MRTLADIVPLRRPDCTDAVEAVSLIAAGEAGGDRRARAHVGQCLRCQAEVAAYRRVLRIMRSMGHDRLDLPPGGLAAAMDALHEAQEDSGGLLPGWWSARAAYVGGLTAASAAGVLVWFTLRRPGLAHAS